MIQKNLSHETLVNNDRYDNLEEYKYYNCEFRNADGSKTIENKNYKINIDELKSIGIF